MLWVLREYKILLYLRKREKEIRVIYMNLSFFRLKSIKCAKNSFFFSFFKVDFQIELKIFRKNNKSSCFLFIFSQFFDGRIGLFSKERTISFTSDFFQIYSFHSKNVLRFLEEKIEYFSWSHKRLHRSYGSSSITTSWLRTRKKEKGDYPIGTIEWKVKSLRYKKLMVIERRMYFIKGFFSKK